MIQWLDSLKGIEDICRMQGKYIECMMVATGWGSDMIKPKDFVEGTTKLFLANK